jgi:steroid 5-alpha reductase family enzyme
MLGWLSPLLENHLVQMLGASLGINWVGWAISAFFHTEKFYDLTGSATFIMLSHFSHSRSAMTSRQNVTSYMVFAWACRLGTFLFMRILKDGKDNRFDKARDDPSMFFKFWTVQALWVWVTLAPTFLLNTERRNPPLDTRDYIGWAIWGGGFIMEVVADMQKSVFKTNPDNAGKFIQSGLWSISRHPNYFGEISLWFGLYLSSSSVFRGAQYLSVLSPVFVMLLITKLSGIPMLEKAGMKKWGMTAEYQKYLEDVPVLIPFIKT